MKKLYLLLFLMFPLFAISAPQAPFGLKWGMEKEEVFRLYDALEDDDRTVSVKSLPEGNDIVSRYLLHFESNRLFNVTAIIDDLDESEYFSVAEKIAKKVYYDYEAFYPENINTEMNLFKNRLSEKGQSTLIISSDDIHIVLALRSSKKDEPFLLIIYNLDGKYKDKMISKDQMKGF